MRKALNDKVIQTITEGDGVGLAAQPEISHILNTANAQTALPKLNQIILKYAPKYRQILGELQ
jgi:hypothetical protein